MNLLCDLEVHSKYARAVSKYMVIPEMAKWAQWKGIDILGTGDFTHPEWMAELQQCLVEDGTGLLRLSPNVSPKETDLRFMLTGEVSLIYSQGGRGRRVHIIVVAPSLVAAQALSQKLDTHGTLSSDGRPVLGLSAKKLLEYTLSVNAELGLIDDIADPSYDKKAGLFLIPAHVWTPWFGLFGSKSGFDSVDECFEELANHIRAIESGLSSDLPMNWRLSSNDRLALVSFSDAHSAPNLMREATMVSVRGRTFSQIAQALQTPTTPTSNKIRSVADLESWLHQATTPATNHIAFTVEFFPEEGKYHYDGIADKSIRMTPAQTRQLWVTNPTLAKKVTVGVLNRVEKLADRPEGYKPENRPGYVSLVPLQEIIADLFGTSKQSKKVQTEYFRLVAQKTERAILLELSPAELTGLMNPKLVALIMAVRTGQLEIEPGYDGLYGVIKIKQAAEKEAQLSLL